MAHDVRNLRFRSILMLLLLATAASHAGFAQTPGGLRGVVTDEGGGAVVGAAVVLSDESGHHATALSDDHGRFQIAAPSEGAATLSIEAPGFSTFTRRVTLRSTEPFHIDVILRVAASARVDVHGSLTGVALDSGQNMSTITLAGPALDALPADPETLLHTLRMLAGTTGTRADQVAFYIDGAPIDRRLPPRDIIQQIRINANPFSAEYSEPGSSRIEIITKPASAEYHGDVRIDFNDSVLNERNLFEPVRPPVQLRTYAGYFGGPVIKNRLGLLAYGAKWEQDENAVVDATTINPTTILPEAIRLNVPTPIRTMLYSIKADTLLTPRHILVLEYARDDQRRSNAGLQSGFDLPEHAYTTQSRDQTASARLTSTVGTGGLNEFRSSVSRHRSHDQADSNTPAVLVLDGFSGGGNPDVQLRDNASDQFNVFNATTLAVGKHAVRFGGQAQYTHLSLVDRANYNGTFTFGTDVVRDAAGNALIDGSGQPIPMSSLELYRQTLLQVPGVRPSQFSIVTGNPAVTVPVTTTAGFVQDDWRPWSRLTLSYGARAEFERELQTEVAFAHRAGLAWAPFRDGRTAVRAGFGLFYSPIPQTLASDVVRSGQTVWRATSRPAFFPAAPQSLPANESLITTRTEAANLQMPELTLSTLSVDRQITARLFASVGFTRRRGADLLRTRIVNTSPGGQLGLAGPTLQFESTGRSRADEWHVTVNGNVGSRVNLFGGYERARAFQDTDGPYTIPSSSADLAAEWGPALIPQHQVSVGASVSVPGSIAIMPFVRASSRLPFNITTGQDNNGDLQFTDRPGLASPGDAGAIVTRYGAFNPNPSPGQAIAPRNSALGPTEFTVDLTVAWLPTQLLTAKDRGSLTVTANNLMNRVNYAPYIGVLNSPFFGTANRALNPRRVTLSVRYEF